MEAAVEPDPPLLVPGGPLFQTLPAEGGGVGTEEIPPSAGLKKKTNDQRRVMPCD